MILEHLLYGLLWIGFGVGHSLLAGERLIRPFGSYYRLIYNGIAILTLVAVLILGRLIFSLSEIDFPPALDVGRIILFTTGSIVFLLGLKSYDAGRFLGITQARFGNGTSQSLAGEPLKVTGINRYVRHPLYAGGLLALWAAVSDQFMLSTAIWITIYTVIGSRIEESRLSKIYGDEYVTYRARVPAFVPWNWKL